ncbi:MAG: methyltransferase domain-containing protein [Alistipes sp.]|nr:methyltransferase domain-containing protein [Alistipes sp.]
MFQFKRFAVRQERSPMKVGTDGVLLGAWTEVYPSDRRILDIGTATGLIALMMAQRAPEAQIVGIDILDIAEARENAAASSWGPRLTFEQCPAQEFTAAEPFDLILSNPPFFVDALTCPDAGRTTARHTVTLSYEDLCMSVVRLLAPDGRFAVVLPLAESERWFSVCNGRLRLVRRTDVRTTPRRTPKRVLLEFVHENAVSESTQPRHDELTIGTGEHEQYTEAYRTLTGDFYLKF